jgi:WhiB family redox-sensing transcriptional regulator
MKITEVITPPEWMKKALCAEVDPEMFYPEKNTDGTVAKRICLRCDVKVECLQYAIDNKEDHGIWGGLNERSRRKLRRKKAA